MLESSTNSLSHTSLQFPDLFGDLRTATPFRIGRVALTCMHLVWFDASGRKALAMMQIKVRSNPPLVVPESSVEYQPPRMTDYALHRIVERQHQAKTHRARHLFAVAAQQALKKYGVKDRVNLSVVFAGLVNGFSFQSAPLMEMIGEVSIDDIIIDADEPGSKAILAANTACHALVLQFPQVTKDPD